MAWYEYKADKPLYRPQTFGKASARDALMVYGVLLLVAVLLVAGLVAIAVFAGWQTLFFVLALGAAYFIMASRQR